MLLIEVPLPRYVYRRLIASKQYQDVIKNIVRHVRSGTTFVLLEDSPKGWWAALKILREGAGKLYIAREIKYLDVPSRIMDLSFKKRWRPQYSQVIEEELKKWGLKYE